MKLGSSDISAVKIGSTDVSKVYIGSTEVWTSFTGLLDTYSGAAAAYSLRLLSSTYTGDAIEVRRASDNTTQDIGFVDGELDTTSLTSFCSGTNGFVTTWYDQSGNGRDATQTTASVQPQIVSSGSVILENGKPAIDNSSDELRFSSFASSGGFAFFAVGNPVGGQPVFVSGGDDGNNRFDFGVRTTSDYRIFITESGTNNRITVSTNYFNNYGLYSATQSDLRVDNSSVNTGTIGFDLSAYTSNNSLFARRLGTGGVALGSSNVSEIIIYNSDQTSNVSGIETNINDFYSIYT